MTERKLQKKGTANPKVAEKKAPHQKKNETE